MKLKQHILDKLKFIDKNKIFTLTVKNGKPVIICPSKKDANDLINSRRRQKVGEKVKVKLIKIDKGEYDFSIKALTEEPNVKQKKSKSSRTSIENMNAENITKTEKVKVKTKLFN